MAKKAGRKPSQERHDDAALAAKMRPEDGPEGRVANAQRGAELAVELEALFNQHFTEPDWQVLVALVGSYVAVMDGAQREARSAAEGWNDKDATRAYMPAKAPDPSQPMMQCIVPARQFGRALRDRRVRMSATIPYRSAQRPDRTVVGLSGDVVVFAPAMGTRELEACAYVILGSPDCWQNEIPADVPRCPDGGVTLIDAIATLGRMVGTCPAAEAAASSFSGYCLARHAAGAPATSPHLRLCAGEGCDTPLFVWSRKAGKSRVGNAPAPNYCPRCNPTDYALFMDKRRDALRRARADRRKKRR